MRKMNPKATLVIRAEQLAEILKGSNGLAELVDNLLDFFEHKFPTIFNKDDLKQMAGYVSGRAKISMEDAELKIGDVLRLTRAEKSNVGLGLAQEEYGYDHALQRIMRIVQATKTE